MFGAISGAAIMSMASISHLGVDITKNVIVGNKFFFLEPAIISIGIVAIYTSNFIVSSLLQD